MSKDFHFARRTDWNLGANQIMQTLESIQEGNSPILDLTESNPTKCGFAYFSKKVLQPLITERNFEYHPNPLGMEEARKIVRDYYREKDIDVPLENIFLVSGTSEGYTYLFRLLANPGEQFLFPSPSYPLFPFLVDLNDAEMDFYPLRYHHAWSVDLDRLRSSISANTKGIVLVNPNNPTGSYIKEKELETLNHLARENQTAIISDEVFWDFGFKDDHKNVTLVQNQGSLTFVLGGISKTLGLPQMKLGWIVMSGPENLVGQARSRLEIIADTYLSVSTPTQNALKTWMSHRKRIQKEIRMRILKNHDYLEKSIAQDSSVQMLSTEGGWYAVLNIPATHSEEEWVLEFLIEDRTFVHPGYFFDFEKEAYIVISLLPERKIFQEGISRILNRLESS